MAGEHEGHRARMRQRFQAEGLSGFASHEALELMLFYAIPQRNVNPLAHTLLKRFGTLHGVLDAPVEELRKVEGVGENAATLLSLFSAVSRRLEQSRQGEKPALRNRMEAQAYCTRLLDGLKQEHMYAVCLNGQMQVLADALIAKGSLNEVPAYPRLVAESVLRHNAHSVVLCHNHPGGNPYPSQSDMDMTLKLGTLLQSIEVTLADHIIVSDGEAFSMSGAGLIAYESDRNGIRARVASSAGETRLKEQIRKRNATEK